jgi:glucose-6-phosphate 1-dehydrogenase
MANFVPVDVFDLVIFGGTGDLAMRKLLPALYHRERDGQITGDSRIIAASRGELSRDEYLGLVEEALKAGSVSRISRPRRACSARSHRD